MTDSDCIRRFVPSGGAVRGQCVRLEAAWLALREHADYPPAVRDLLGEAVCAAALLAATIKFDGLLTLQIQGGGAVRLLVAQCTADFKLRGVARFDAGRVAAETTDLLGESQLTVTVDATGRGANRYQGIVPVAGGSIGASLQHYFDQSEQLPTALLLSADAAGAAGVVVQRVASSGGQDVDDDSVTSQWDAAAAAVALLQANELRHWDMQRLASYCGAGVDVRLQAGHNVSFECRCSRERVLGMLRSLGQQEITATLAEQGAVTVTCEFCQRPWRFDAIDMAQLFADDPLSPAAAARIN